MSARADGARRVGAIDCGTNTLRLLIADVADGDPPRLADVVRRMETVRLGEGVDATGVLAPAALERASRALGEYAEQLRETETDQVRMVATSAVRDAANRDDFTAMVRTHLDVEPDVVSGTEEAGLTAAGVVSGLGITGPSLVLDIGGGSTEFVRSSGDPRDAAGISTDIGVVRLSERHLHQDPPTLEQADLVRADTLSAVEQARAELGDLSGLRVLGVAGTVTTAVGIALGLDRYDSATIHGATVSREQLELVLRWALESDTATRTANPVMHPGRAPVFPAGMLILTTILDEIGAACVTASETDILDGIALSIA
ncbi:exopolyphosphatase [Epidermidibacterium keratini]|uniref:Exopolyphosphatase n=1 Tax=Epidermidibacterium keratini TaxID=1891644 RepID=A0A7L4YPT8_9ACTN|nr:Ppx/GppA phosphatase family protein [Epidermidibacterium keratini]QHC01291.1 exopolyphosphatase [Epidermidibacterium keratini]